MKASFFKRISLTVIALFSFTGCMTDDLIDMVDGNNVENFIVPRIMVEERGVEYGNLRGMKVTMPVSKTEIHVLREPVVGEYEIINIDMVQFDLGIGVQIHVTERGARALYRNSVTHRGQRIVLLANDRAIGARTIDGDMTDGRFYMYLEMPDDEVEQFVLDLRESIAELQTQYKY